MRSTRYPSTSSPCTRKTGANSDASRTVTERGPLCESSSEPLVYGAGETRPRDGLMPKRPQQQPGKSDGPAGATGAGPLSDRTLLRQVRDGNQDAAGLLYARYAQRLLALARSKQSRDLTGRRGGRHL